jgi:hypothetical protein
MNRKNNSKEPAAAATPASSSSSSTAAATTAAAAEPDPVVIHHVPDEDWDKEGEWSDYEEEEIPYDEEDLKLFNCLFDIGYTKMTTVQHWYRPEDMTVIPNCMLCFGFQVRSKELNFDWTLKYNRERRWDCKVHYCDLVWGDLNGNTCRNSGDYILVTGQCLDLNQVRQFQRFLNEKMYEIGGVWFQEEHAHRISDNLRPMTFDIAMDSKFNHFPEGVLQIMISYLCPTVDEIRENYTDRHRTEVLNKVREMCDNAERALDETEGKKRRHATSSAASSLSDTEDNNQQQTSSKKARPSAIAASSSSSSSSSSAAKRGH